MPDESGRMSKAETQDVMVRLNNLQPNPPPCAFCGKKKWVVENVMTEVRALQNAMPSLILHRGSNPPSQLKMPLIQLACRNCGNSLFFNAVRLGVVTVESGAKDNNGNGNIRPD